MIDLDIQRKWLIPYGIKILKRHKYHGGPPFFNFISFLLGEEGRKNALIRLSNEVLDQLEKKADQEGESFENLNNDPRALVKFSRQVIEAISGDDSPEVQRIGERMRGIISKDSGIKEPLNPFGFRNVPRDELDPIAEIFFNFHKSYPENRSGFKIICGVLENVRDKLGPRVQTHSQELNSLAITFELNDLQKEIVFAMYLMEKNSSFKDMLGGNRYDYGPSDYSLSKLAEAIGVSSQDLRKEMALSSPLMTFGFLKRERWGVDIANHIFQFLDGKGDGNIFNHLFSKWNIEEALPLEIHRIEKGVADLLKSLINSGAGANILLYGKSGTGKTEFAKGLAKELELDLYGIKNDDGEEDTSFKDKKTTLICAKKVLTGKKLIFAVDEAEKVLRTGGSHFFFMDDQLDQKAWLNQFMDGHEMNVIWIVNDLTMHESTKRRFDLVIHFDSFSKEQRLFALTNIQKKNSLEIFNGSELEKLISEFDLEPGPFDRAFKKVARMENLKSEAGKKKAVKRILKSQFEFLKGGEVREKPLEKGYNPYILNTSKAPEEILKNLAMFEDSAKIRNLCLLFQGPPGTGKTEFVKYISEFLGKKLIVKRASDLMSKWLGDSEKNIASAFAELDSSKSILFLDECDSLFNPRENAQRSWEVSQTNELLTQMELFEGILICATNFVDNLDRAAMRRFHLKVKFDYMRPQDALNLYESFFATLVEKPLTEMERQDLLKLKGITPGDYKAVFNANVFNEKVTHVDLIGAVAEELSYRKEARPIGL